MGRMPYPGAPAPGRGPRRWGRPRPSILETGPGLSLPFAFFMLTSAFCQFIVEPSIFFSQIGGLIHCCVSTVHTFEYWRLFFAVFLRYY